MTTSGYVAITVFDSIVAELAKPRSHPRYGNRTMCATLDPFALIQRSGSRINVNYIKRHPVEVVFFSVLCCFIKQPAADPFASKVPWVFTTSIERYRLLNYRFGKTQGLRAQTNRLPYCVGDPQPCPPRSRTPD